MSRGIWEGSTSIEDLDQSRLTRHDILCVSLGQNLAAGWGAASSGLASLDPNSIVPKTHNAVTDRGPEGGPHFVMSGDTPDQAHTFGFEFALFTDGLSAGSASAPGVGGYTVTVWALISNTFFASASTPTTPVWAQFLTRTGVGVRQLWHSFDVNATCIRFQITNAAENVVTTNKLINIAFAEL